MDTVTITRHGTAEKGEYHGQVPGNAAVGRLTWHARGTARVADHTLVPGEIGGRGVAMRLVEALIADARAEGFKIVPQCSYIAAAFARQPAWSDLIAPEQG